MINALNIWGGVIKAILFGQASNLVPYDLHHIADLYQTSIARARNATQHHSLGAVTSYQRSGICPRFCHTYTDKADLWF
jgi:hypothetical protein